MAYCPHCNIYYDEDNETQPCCGCGHPITCCGTHTDSPHSGYDDGPSPAELDRILEDLDLFSDEEPEESDDLLFGPNARTGPSDETFDPDDELPF